MNNKICGIYRIKNIITGDCYIGSSFNIQKRMSYHKLYLKRNKHHCIKLQRSYNKYGINNFIYEVICKCDRQLLLYLEQQYINAVKPFFNTAIDALAPMKGRKHSPETILKFKNKNTKNGKDHHLFGIPWSDSLREKILSKRIGSKRSEEFKRKRSEQALKDNRWKFLMKHIEQCKKPIKDDQGNTFNSLVECSIFYNVSVSSVCDVLKGRTKLLKKKIKLEYFQK